MVLDDARLLVEDSVARDRRTVGGARDRHLHREMAPRDHPGEQFEGAGRHRIKRSERHRGQVPLYRIAQPLTAFDGHDLRLFEGAADDQPHMAVVAHQTFDAARRQGKRTGAEVAGKPIVAHGVLQCRHIEQLDQVTVVGGVFEVPGAIGEHGQTRSSCHSLSCSGSSMRSRYAKRYRL